jgi:hypothetical protein
VVAATKVTTARLLCPEHLRGQVQMSGIIYLVGLVVIVMAILSFLGLR